MLVHDQGDRDPDAQISRARMTVLSSSGRATARVEIFSEKIRVTPGARSESTWVSGNWRTVEARAYPPRMCRRCGAGHRRAGQLGPGRTRLAQHGNRDAEGLGQVGHEPEPGGVVLDGYPAPAGPARRPGRGRAG